MAKVNIILVYCWNIVSTDTSLVRIHSFILSLSHRRIFFSIFRHSIYFCERYICEYSVTGLYKKLIVESLRRTACKLLFMFVLHRL